MNVQTTIKTLSLFLILSGLVLTSCMVKTFNVTSLKRTPEAINAIKANAGILCVSFDLAVDKGIYNFTRNLAIELKLYNHETKSIKKVAAGPFNQDLDDNKFYYLFIPAGTYELSGIEATPIKLSVLAQTTMGDYKWNLRVEFSKREPHKINAGDIIYLGSYKIIGKKVSTEFKFTNFELIDNYQTAQKDLNSIMGNEDLQLEKKLNLLNNINDLEYNFPQYKETILDWL